MIASDTLLRGIPLWREVDAAWLNRQIGGWRDEGVENCALAAARALDALRRSESDVAVKILCGADADVGEDDDIEDVAISIDPAAVVQNIDGDDVVIMPTIEAHRAFVDWCVGHVSWD